MMRALKWAVWGAGWLACLGVSAASLWRGNWDSMGRIAAPLAGLREWLLPAAAVYLALLLTTTYLGLRCWERIERPEGE